MRSFANIKEALDFATGNQHRLRFPFTCKCNGFPLRVLSPELARTLGGEGPSLVATRTPSAGLELGYLLTVKALRDILYSLGPGGVTWNLGIFGDHVVVERALAASSSEFTFSIVKRIPEASQDEGTFVLLKAPQQTPGWQEFWATLETRLLHQSINPAA